MGYTDTVKGKSGNVLITDVAQSIADLISEAIDPKTNRVEITFTGGLTGINPIAWITEDPDVTLAPNNGEAVYVGAEITVTEENFPNFKILKHSGGDFNMWLKQLDSEQDRL